MKFKIDQKVALNQSYGDVLRSGAIFYFELTDKLTTTLSFLNYWKTKNNIEEVAIIANVRKLDGTFCFRERLSFEEANVINYRPSQEMVGENFIGSVEIEIISTKNLRVPFPGIIAIYETKKGISMVHTYGRTYSNHEVEEKRTITQGHCSCWSILDDELTHSCFIGHNGNQLLASQKITITVVNHKELQKTLDIDLPEVKPYGTFIIKLADYFSDLVSFLEGKPGHVSLDYKLNNSFARLLIINRRNDFSDMQLTHSNFNYKKNQTDTVQAKEPLAFMHLPSLNYGKSSLQIYPDMHPGKYIYTLEKNGDNYKPLESKMTTSINLENDKSQILRIKNLKGDIPSRLVTGLRVSLKKDLIPAECSLNVIHEKYFKKYYTWGIYSENIDHKSFINLTKCDTVYGELPKDLIFEMTFYRPSKFDTETFQLTSETVEEMNKMPFEVSKFIEKKKKSDSMDYGYVTVKTNYPGFIIYSSICNKNKSYTIEHWF